MHAANNSGASAVHYLCANRVFNAYEHKGYEATHHSHSRRRRRSSLLECAEGEEEEEEEYVESGFAEPLLALIANHVNNNNSASGAQGFDNSFTCRDLANCRDNFNTTPLLVAILHRQWGIARFLLQVRMSVFLILEGPAVSVYCEGI